MLDTILWTERYRPKSLEALALPEDARTFLKSCLEKGEIPHLLLSGPPGVGKTSLAFILRDSLDCKCLLLNASKERGIDVVRDTITNFARGNLGARWNIVILDEADFLTREAQNALRNLMETYADVCRFVLTANHLSKIEDAIQSRCHHIPFMNITRKSRYGVLYDILENEGIVFAPEDALTYVDAFADMRKTINEAQKAAIVAGGALPPYKDNPLSGKKVFEYIQQNDWDALVKVAQMNGVDYTLLLSELFWAVPGNSAQAANTRYMAAKALKALSFAPDPPIHFLGLCAQIIKETQ